MKHIQLTQTQKNPPNLRALSHLQNKYQPARTAATGLSSFFTASLKCRECVPRGLTQHSKYENVNMNQGSSPLWLACSQQYRSNMQQAVSYVALHTCLNFNPSVASTSHGHSPGAQEYYQTCHLCAVVSSLTVGEKNHPQCSSRVSQQITVYLSHFRDAPSPSLWNGQNKSLLQTPAHGGMAACEFQAPLSPPALPQLWGITPAAPEFTARWLHPSSPQPSHTWSQSSQSTWFWDSSSGQSQTESTEAADSLSPLSPQKSVYLSLFLIFCHHIFLHNQ